jgi:hypothetical protein
VKGVQQRPELLMTWILQIKYHLSEKEALKLAKDFWLVFSVLHKDLIKYVKLAKKKGILAPIMLHSLVICCKCSLSEEEGNPVSTGIIIGDFDDVSTILPINMEIPLPEELDIRDWKAIRKFCGYVDGETAAFIIDTCKCRIKGAKNIRTHIDSYSEVTNQLGESLGLVVVKGRKCFRLYSDGAVAHQAILIRKYGEWANRDMKRHLEKLKSMTSRKGIGFDFVERIFRASLRISEIGQGAQFLIVDKKSIKALIRSEKQLSSPKRVDEMTDEQLIRNVTMDGAAVFEKTGELASVETKFLATGGRLASILDVTKSASDALALVVSMDGEISIVEDGKIVARL